MSVCSRDNCLKVANQQCSGCGVASYCSVECQKAAWPTHKLECHKKNIDCPKCQKMSRFHLHEARINAIVVKVVDYRTLKVIFMPFSETAMKVRMVWTKHMHKHKEMSEEQRSARKEYLEKLFFGTESEGPEDSYPIASVVVVGDKTLKNGKKIILASIYVPENCRYDEKMLMAYADQPDSIIADLAVAQSYAMLKKVSQAELHKMQTMVGAKWMQHAVKHPGALGRWGHSHHILKKGGHWNSKNLVKATKVAKKTPGKHDDRMVALAKTFAKFRKHK